MPDPFRPSVTVAAVIERDGRFLLVEERTADGLRLNQPAGHLDLGESLLAAAARETLEETAFAFTPTQLVGVYLWRAGSFDDGAAPTYLRFAFAGELGHRDPARPLDRGIVRTLWLTREQIAQRREAHRSPLVQRCVDDYLRGVRYPLDLLYTHPSALLAAASGDALSDPSQAFDPTSESGPPQAPGSHRSAARPPAAATAEPHHHSSPAPAAAACSSRGNDARPEVSSTPARCEREAARPWVRSEAIDGRPDAGVTGRAGAK